MRERGFDIDCSHGRTDICVIGRIRDKTLTFYRFDHTKGEGAEAGRMAFDTRLYPSFAVSPDGSKIAVLNPAGIGNRIRLIPLEGGSTSELEVPGRRQLTDLCWAPDGKGWFVSSVTPANGEYLLHVGLRGESQVLYEQPQDGRDTWGDPSPDGKHLAFLRWTAERNVWMIDDF
jgi:hypothetical protein